MPITVFKEFREGGKWPSHGKVTRIPYEIYTLAEAHDRNIMPVKNWREAVFHRGEDLSGQYILTDDNPPLVTPIAVIRYDKGVDSLGRKITKVHFPWTWTSSSTAKILYGVRGYVHTSSVRLKFKNTNSNVIKTFFLLFALGANPKKIVSCIWSIKNELEQEYLLRLMMMSDKTQQAVSELARDVFGRIGADPDKIAKAMWDLAKAEDTPATVKKDVLQDIADRTVLTDKQEKPQPTGFLGMDIGRTIEGAPVLGQIQGAIQEELEQQAKDNTKIRALIEPQGEEVLDE